MTSPSTTSGSSSSTIWLVVALLWPVALLNYLDRQMLAAMKASVMADIPSISSAENWGYMLGQFKWVYAFMSPLGGYVADRFSRRFMICVSLAVWSAVTLATGYVTTYDGLLFTRTLMGISEAFYFPAALALIADYHTGSTRSRAVGIHQMAVYCGGIAGGFSGYIADAPDFGWRWAFHATGLLGILYSVPLFLCLRDRTKAPVEKSAPVERYSVLVALKELFRNGSFLLLVGYFTLPGIAGWVVRDWMPAILKEKFDISQGLAGVSATLYVSLAAIVGAMAGGWLADRWMLRTPRGRIYASALGTSLFIPAMFGVGYANSLTVAILFLMVFGLGWGTFDCNNMPILSQIVKPQHRATAYGLLNFVGINLGGIADWWFGVLRDRHVSLETIFAVFPALAIISIVLVLLIRPRPSEVGAGEVTSGK